MGRARMWPVPHRPRPQPQRCHYPALALGAALREAPLPRSRAAVERSASLAPTLAHGHINSGLEEEDEVEEEVPLAIETEGARARYIEYKQGH